MNGIEEENGFNESKARNLVYYLLENDINTFKKLIPEIKNMDSKSFHQLFMGNFNNTENVNYNKKIFEKLSDKFDNFCIILDSWYLDNKYRSYIKELWINYISIENLIKKMIKRWRDY